MALRPRKPRANRLNACRAVATGTMKRLPMLMHICVSRQRFRVYPSGKKDSLQGIDTFERPVDGEVQSTLCSHQRVRSFCSQDSHNTGDHQASPGDHRKKSLKPSSKMNPVPEDLPLSMSTLPWSPLVSMEQHPWQEYVCQVHKSFKLFVRGVMQGRTRLIWAYAT